MCAVQRAAVSAAVLPELIVDDLAASLAFYRLLGFRVLYERPAERFAHLTLGDGADLMLEQPLDQERMCPRAELAHPYGRGVNLSVDVEDVTAVHDALVDAGHAVPAAGGALVRAHRRRGGRPSARRRRP